MAEALRRRQPREAKEIKGNKALRKKASGIGGLFLLCNDIGRRRGRNAQARIRVSCLRRSIHPPNDPSPYGLG